MSTSMPETRHRPLVSAFARWLAEGQKDVLGTIQQPNDAGRFAYIKPDAFPEERLYFSFREWPDQSRQRSLQGRLVGFDVETQAWKPERTPEASNVRLL